MALGKSAQKQAQFCDKALLLTLLLIPAVTDTKPGPF
jgi:hypothetical protein